MAKNPRLIDISGQRFGDWLVIEQAGNTKGGGALWRSRCSCGVERPVLGADLRGGKSTNCGCAKVARIAALNVSHGESGSRLHRIWGNMRARCNRPRSTGYARYGGRGITVCDEWDRSYEAFRDWARASGYTDDLSIERVDVDRGYCPENCTWADHTTQSRNRRFVRGRHPLVDCRQGQWNCARRVRKSHLGWRLGRRDRGHYAPDHSTQDRGARR